MAVHLRRALTHADDEVEAREEAGRIVIDPVSGEGLSDLMICCPVTTQIKSYPFEVMIEGMPPSVALADQIRSRDWRVRRAERKGKVAPGELADVRAKIKALIAP